MVKCLLEPESRVHYVIVSKIGVKHSRNIYTHRFGNNLLPYSLEGDPAPARPEPSWAPARLLPRGYLKPEPAGSMGAHVELRQAFKVELVVGTRGGCHYDYTAVVIAMKCAGFVRRLLLEESEVKERMYM
jgi:hypothetical protein